MLVYAIRCGQCQHVWCAQHIGEDKLVITADCLLDQRKAAQEVAIIRNAISIFVLATFFARGDAIIVIVKVQIIWRAIAIGIIITRITILVQIFQVVRNLVPI